MFVLKDKDKNYQEYEDEFWDYIEETSGGDDEEPTGGSSDEESTP